MLCLVLCNCQINVYAAVIHSVISISWGVEKIKFGNEIFSLFKKDKYNRIGLKGKKEIKNPR